MGSLWTMGTNGVDMEYTCGIKIFRGVNITLLERDVNLFLSQPGLSCINTQTVVYGEQLVITVSYMEASWK